MPEPTKTPETLRNFVSRKMTDDWYGGEELLDMADAWEARERVLDALSGFIRDSCYKHGRGDDACSCDWLDETLAGTTRSPAKGEEKGVTK